MRIAILALLLGVTSVRADETALLLWLRGAPSQLVDESGLLESVAIYTRDLRYRTSVHRDAPTEISAETLGQVAADLRKTGARLAFFVHPRRGPEGLSGVLYVVEVRGPAFEAHALPLPSIQRDELPRVIALKVRAVLIGLVANEPREPAPAPILPPAPAPPPPPSAPAAAPPPVSPPPRAPSWRPDRLRLLAGYRLVLPLERALLRHALLSELALGLRMLEVFVNVEVANRPTVRREDRAASLFAVPLRLGVRAGLQRRRWGGAIGVAVGAHILDVSGSRADGRHGDSTSVVGSVGIGALAEVRLMTHLSVELRADTEYLFPDRRFSVDGVTMLHGTGLYFGLSLALRATVPIVQPNASHGVQ